MVQVVPVLGMHRSGTSALTGTLSHMGVHIGEPSELMQYSPQNSGETNVKGFFEYKQIVDIHEDMMAMLNVTWHSVGEWPCDWMSTVAPKMDELKKIVQNQLDHHDQWGFKDPRACRFLPLWHEILAGRDVGAIICVRHPASVARSLAVRNGITLEHGYQLWMTHMLAALLGVGEWGTLVVDYELLLRDTAKQVERICVFLGCSPLDIRWSELDEFLDDSMRHQRPGAQRPGNGLPEAVAELYDILSRASKEVISAAEAVNLAGIAAVKWRPNRELLVYVGQVEQRELRAQREIEMNEAGLAAAQEDHDRKLCATVEQYQALLTESEEAYSSALTELNDAQVGRVRALEEEYARQVAELEGRYLARLEAVAHEREQILAEHDAARAELTAVRSSTSWRITAPLRAVSDVLRVGEGPTGSERNG